MVRISRCQRGDPRIGYYNQEDNVFVSTAQDKTKRIVTVIKPRNPENYIKNVKSRQ